MKISRYDDDDINFVTISKYQDVMMTFSLKPIKWQNIMIISKYLTCI